MFAGIPECVGETQIYLTSLGNIMLKSWNYSSVVISKMHITMHWQCSSFFQKEMWLFNWIFVFRNNPFEDSVGEGEAHSFEVGFRFNDFNGCNPLFTLWTQGRFVVFYLLFFKCNGDEASLTFSLYTGETEHHGISLQKSMQSKHTLYSQCILYLYDFYI